MGHGAVAFVFSWEACSFVSCIESHLGTAGKKPPLPEHIQGQDNVWKRGEEWSEMSYTKGAGKRSCQSQAKMPGVSEGVTCLYDRGGSDRPKSAAQTLSGKGC